MVFFVIQITSIVSVGSFQTLLMSYSLLVWQTISRHCFVTLFVPCYLKSHIFFLQQRVCIVCDAIVFKFLFFSFAHLEFESEEVAEKVMSELQNSKIKGRSIALDYVGEKRINTKPLQGPG